MIVGLRLSHTAACQVGEFRSWEWDSIYRAFGWSSVRFTATATQLWYHPLTCVAGICVGQLLIFRIQCTVWTVTSLSPYLQVERKPICCFSVAFHWTWTTALQPVFRLTVICELSISAPWCIYLSPILGFQKMGPSLQILRSLLEQCGWFIQMPNRSWLVLSRLRQQFFPAQELGFSWIDVQLELAGSSTFWFSIWATIRFYLEIASMSDHSSALALSGSFPAPGHQVLCQGLQATPSQLVQWCWQRGSFTPPSEVKPG